MALRPVSELGLVEVTDVATPAAAAPQRSRKPPKPRLETGGPVCPSQRRPENPASPSSSAAGVATSIRSGAIGVAGALWVWARDAPALSTASRDEPERLRSSGPPMQRSCGLPCFRCATETVLLTPSSYFATT
jgi:hypothetical protein